MRKLRHPNLWQGCVGAWCPSLGATGYRLIDRSGRGNHGVLTNMTIDDWVISDNKVALNFNGTNADVRIKIPEILSNATAIVWFTINTLAVSTQALFGNGTSNINQRFSCHAPWSDNILYFDFGGATSGTNRIAIAGLSWSVNTLYNISCSTGTNGMRVTRNGVLVGSNSANPTRAASYNNTTYLGRLEDNVSSNYYFPGKIYDIKYYNRQLSDQQCIQIYNRGIYGMYETYSSSKLYLPNQILRDYLSRRKTGMFLAQ